jgi:hypothetical protein
MASRKGLSKYHKYSGLFTLLIVGVMALGVATIVATSKQSVDTRSRASGGNGAPVGTHYNLNIIGVPKDKTAAMTGSNGGRIFVPLTGSCQIKLSLGSFQVLDGNCTDGSGTFQLPNPDPDNDGITSYSVWARALGKPGGSSKTTTCATDPTDGQLYCSLNAMVSVRTKGKTSFTNVSKELLYVYADIDGDGTVDRMPLFDSRLENYYWQYDNNGLKLVQLRFYQVSTNVN